MHTNKWKDELKRVSLIGLSQVDVGVSLKKLLREQQLLSGDKISGQSILSAISLLYLQEKAHHNLPQDHLAHQLHPINEEKDYISPELNHHLELILNGEFKWTLFEFVQKVEAEGKLIHPYRIPKLIECASSENWLAAHIEGLTGRLGSWALAHNPDWNSKYQELPHDRWQYPPSIEKKVFPLLNMKRPVEMLQDIWVIVEVPGLTWSRKLSDRMMQYLDVAILQTRDDESRDEYLQDLIILSAYLLNPFGKYELVAEKYLPRWTAAVDKFNRIVPFRQKMVVA